MATTLKMKRRDRQRKHLRKHPKFPAPPRTFNAQTDAAPKSVTPTVAGPHPVQPRPAQVRPTAPAQSLPRMADPLPRHDSSTTPAEPVAEQQTSAANTQLAADLALPIEELDLNVRAYNLLKRNGVDTIGQLVAKSKFNLLDIRNMGQKSIDEIKTKLAGMGLALAPDPTL